MTAISGRGRVTGLTKRQVETLDFIRRFIAAHAYSPSYAEIAKGIGILNRSGAHRIVHELRDRGAIDFLDRRDRSIYVTEAAA